MLILINTQEVAEEMVNRGIVPDEIRDEEFTGWTNCLIETIESLYNVENEVLKDVLKRR